ncbi:hypothetical protein [Mucilaginibacter sp. FT3.2]|uniref:hypothetical protein n=1 Tax=Mucilaginibacter sp. FT3.2 TaxID=2723090 RepID=UPI00161BA6BC|nr:hypothetical protein [Mucilaginibacter sp. FT3.2]MBB6232987.1 hypothetical protein [Mucilaginibacter sp. FT3.2]
MDKEILKEVDLFLDYISKNAGSSLGHGLTNFNSDIGRQVKFILDNDKLIQYNGTLDSATILYISDIGKKILAAGGYEKWLIAKDHIEETKNSLEEKKLKKEVEKLTFDVKYAKSAFIISVVSIICAIAAILISVIYHKS